MKRIKGEKCRLSDLKIGQLCKILSLEMKNIELKIHLLEMGIIPGTITKMKKKSPFRRSNGY